MSLFHKYVTDLELVNNGDVIWGGKIIWMEHTESNSIKHIITAKVVESCLHCWCFFKSYYVHWGLVNGPRTWPNNEYEDCTHYQAKSAQ